MDDNKFSDLFGETLAKQSGFYLWLRKQKGHIHSTSERYTKEIIKVFGRCTELEQEIINKDFDKAMQTLRDYIAKYKTRLTLFSFKKYMEYLAESRKDKDYITSFADRESTIKKIPIYQKKDKIILSEAQVKQLINHIDLCSSKKKDDLKLFVILAYETGARMSALIGLTIGKVIYDQNRYWVYLTEKRGKKRRFPLSQSATKMVGLKISKLKEMKLESPTQKLFSISYPSVERHLRDITKTYLGVDGFTTHSLRRSRITHIYNKTKDAMLCKKFAGHSSLSTTQIYIAEMSEDEMNQLVGDLNW